ncbi:MAG: TolC family protein [Epsilonproteobacteria bacterium]|nr:TolC family protein [Campylobacterota bacterium]NPA56142.1 TolC family protein [Campylobacterota bacterium]
MRRLLLIAAVASFSFASLEHLSLSKAIELVKKNNREIKIAQLKEKIASFNTKIAESYNLGQLDLTLNALRSNDSGNVFGFKLQSREATFKDFGFSEFLGGVGQALAMAQGDFNTFSQMMKDPNMQAMLLNTAPHDLNNPKARNHFQTKLSYMVPLYTGLKLTMYKRISKAMEKMSHLDTKKVLNEKIYQTKKTFYDISLVEEYIANLKILKKNMDRLEEIIKSFKEEGYAKETDVMEVKAKKYEVLSYLNQAQLNRRLAYQYLSFLIGEEVKSIQKPEENPPFLTEETSKLVPKTIDLEKVALAKKITRMNVELQRSEYKPTIGAFGEYGSSDNVPLNDFFDKDFYTVGAQLKWNLFGGGKREAQVQKAKIEHLKVNEQYALAKRGLALKIDQLKTAIKSKEYDIKAQSAQYELAKKIYQMYVGKYKEGLESITNVLIKHAEEIQVLLKLLKTKTERTQKIFELESLIDKESR